MGQGRFVNSAIALVAALALSSVLMAQTTGSSGSAPAKRSPAPKTKRMAGILKALGVDKALVIDGKENANLFKSVRNLPRAKALAPEGLNVYDILNHTGLVVTAGAVKQIEARVTAEKAAAAPA